MVRKLNRYVRKYAVDILNNARKVVRQTKTLSNRNKYIYEVITVPTIDQIERMDKRDAVRILNQLGRLRSERDLRVHAHGQGVASNYSLQKYMEDFNQAEKHRAALRSEIPIDTVAGTMGAEIDTETRPRTPVDLLNLPADFPRIMAREAREAMYSTQNERDQRYKDNYFKSLRNAYGPLAEELINRLQNLDAHKLAVFSLTNPETQINFNTYKLPYNEQVAAMEAVSSLWDNYYETSGLELA